MKRSMMIGFTLLSATAGLAACVMTPQQLADQKARDDAELADAVKGRVSGKPVDCIDSNGIGGPQIIGTTLVYRQGAGKLWTSSIESCPSLRDDPLIIAELYGSQMCRGDRFRTLPRGSSIPSGFCVFNSFTPYVKPKPKG